MKTKHILYLFIFIGITSCINNKEYFIFEEVIHYQFEQSQLEKVKTNYSENKNQVDTLFDNIFYNSYPISINDTTFLNSLDLLTSKKQSFKQENKLKEFRKIFRKRMYNNYEEAACEPLYRDVFIFKNKIIYILFKYYQCIN